MADGETETLALLQRWNAGDSAALQVLIQKNLDWMSEYVHGRLGDVLRGRAETQDFVQEAMVEVLQYGPRFEVADEDSFRGLLARIVENNIRDQRRHFGRQRRDLAREWGRASDTVLRLDPPVRDVTRPSQHVQKEERQAWVRLALELLAPEDREVIWLREFEELPFAEVGARLEVSEDAARMRFQRALPKLAHKVAELRGGGISRLLAARATDDGSDAPGGAP